MAANDSIQNMYDVALKPLLLRSLLKEYVPDEKHPFQSPSDLSIVVSAVKSHLLLSESTLPTTEQRIIDSWKSAVDAWVNRLLALASSSTPDKCWAGICLLGVTCQECSSERFLASYSAWFNKLLSHIQPPADRYFVKAASCASISDLLTRLAGYPNEKKDGNSQAGKLIQPVLKLLNEDRSEVVWEEAVCLLCTVINIFPSSVQRHYDSVEAAIVAKIMSGKCNDSILKQFGHGLALLPKSKGDEDSWSLMMQKFLISINTQLNDAFQGLENETKRDKPMKLLLPPGKETPPALGGLTVSGENLGQLRPELLLMCRISTLMRCCCEMLTNSYPVQVLIPVRALIALAERVLLVDGSSSNALYPFLGTMKLELICSELPHLHMYSLELLSSLVQGFRSLLLPYTVDIIQLLAQYFGKCVLPDLRIKVYMIVKVLLLSMGVGIVEYIAQDVIHNAHLDLETFGSESGRVSSSVFSISAEPSSQPRQKKRKHSTASGSLGNKDDLDVEMTLQWIPIPVKIAALEAIEALLTVGGAFKSETWRSNIDHFLIIVALNACKGGFVKEEENSVLSGEHTFNWADFQLAALRALLASLISPSRVRPRYLSHGLELFRRGTRERGTKVAEYCAHALLTLEVLIHPRALPLEDSDSAIGNYGGVNRKFPENMYFNIHKQDTGNSAGKLVKGPGEPDSDHDDPLEIWLQSDEETENPVADLKKPNHPEEASKVPISENPPFGDARHNNKVLEDKELVVSAAGAVTGVTEDGDVVMVELQNSQDVRKPSREYISNEDGTSTTVAGGDRIAQSGISISRDGALGHMINDSESGKDILVTKSHVKAPIDDSVAATSGKDMVETKDDALNKIGEEVTGRESTSDKRFSFESDNESIDSIPDIVDGDPDSD